MKRLINGAALLSIGLIASAAGAADRDVAALDRDDKKFVEETAKSNMGEIEISREVLNKTTNPEVKNFASQVQAEHQKLTGELQNLAQQQNLKLPTSIDRDSERMVNDVKKMSGNDLDKQYIDHVVKSHEKWISNFEKASKDAKNPQLKQWVDSTLPDLRNHLTRAESVQSRLQQSQGGQGQQKGQRQGTTPGDIEQQPMNPTEDHGQGGSGNY